GGEGGGDVRRGLPRGRGRAGRARPVPGREVRCRIPGPGEPGSGCARAGWWAEPMTLPGLTSALDLLAGVAAHAGLPEQEVRAEGAAFAAAIAESAPGAAQAWASELSPPVPAFCGAAGGPRRWRSAPTALLTDLVAAGSPHAPEYARALTEVAASACGLGEPTMRVVANASVAAAAQLRAA